MLHGQQQLFQSRARRDAAGGPWIPITNWRRLMRSARATSWLQLAATGCLRQTFTPRRRTSSDRVMALAAEVDPAFVARTASMPASPAI